MTDAGALLQSARRQLRRLPVGEHREPAEPRARERNRRHLHRPRPQLQPPVQGQVLQRGCEVSPQHE